MVVSLVLARSAYRYDFKCRVHQLALISLSLFGNDHGGTAGPIACCLDHARPWSGLFYHLPVDLWLRPVCGAGFEVHFLPFVNLFLLSAMFPTTLGHASFGPS